MLRPVPIPLLKSELKNLEVSLSKLYVLFQSSFWTAAEERNLLYQHQASKSTTTSRFISSSPIVPRRPSSPLVISVSSPKQSPSPSLLLRRVAQKVTDEAALSLQSSVHSSRSSLSEEAEAGPLVSSLLPVPPPVLARLAKVLNTHSQMITPIHLYRDVRRS